MLCIRNKLLIFCSLFLAHAFSVVKDTEISSLIALSFLQERYKNTEHDYVLADKTKAEKVFGENDSAVVELYDIKMRIKRDQYNTKRFVIIETEVRGSPEDFKNQNVLDVEAGLLKYILIRGYLGKIVNQKAAVSIHLDKQTRAIRPPHCYVERIQQSPFSPKTEWLNNEYMWMMFKTVFTAVEFDAFIDKIFVDVPANEQKE